MRFEREKSAPCGALCAACARFPLACAGCGAIAGKPHWLQYTGQSVCAVYDCCVNTRHAPNCGGCERLPCEKFTSDPTLTQAENEQNLRAMLARLREQ